VRREVNAPVNLQVPAKRKLMLASVELDVCLQQQQGQKKAADKGSKGK
jgi:hypothetical protein